MSSVAKNASNAAAKVNWSTIVPQLGLAGKTSSQLLSFKKRNDEAKTNLYLLKQEPTEVDFAGYKGKLNNSAIATKIESDIKKFVPTKADLTKQLNLIDAYEAKAVKNAEETESLVLKELEDLEKTLDNIESARPFDQLTIDDVVKARPDVETKVQDMLDHGRFEVPGYKEKFGDLTIM